MRNTVIAACSALLLTLVACGRSTTETRNDWRVESAVAATPRRPTSQVTQVQPKGTPQRAPTRTAAAVPATPTPVQATQERLPERLLAPVDDAGFWARFPKDPSGRVIGGTFRPVLNYAPDMITGKRCPRVTDWTLDFSVEDKLPNMAVAMPSNPCVLQNAIDDYVRTLFASPVGYTREAFVRDVAPLYQTDPALTRGLSVLYRTSLVDLVVAGKGAYLACDRPIYHLIDTSQSAWVLTNNTGEVASPRAGQTIELRLLTVAVTPDGTDIAPYRCALRSHTDGALLRSQVLSAEALAGGRSLPPGAYYAVWLSYDASSRAWVDQGLTQPRQGDGFQALARSLYAAAPVKP